MTLCRHILSDDNNKAVTMRRNISYDCSLTKLLLVVRWTLGSRERTQAYRRCTFDFFNAYFSVLKMHISLFLRLHISLFPKLLCVPLLLHWLGFTWSAWEAWTSHHLLRHLHQHHFHGHHDRKVELMLGSFWSISRIRKMSAPREIHGFNLWETFPSVRDGGEILALQPLNIPRYHFHVIFTGAFSVIRQWSHFAV